MNNQQMKVITTNPKAMIDFHITGKLPQLKDSLSTPLRDLLLSISVSERERYKGITVDHRLGFTGQLTFHSVFQLLRWLGHQQQVVNNQTLPYYGFVNRRFQQRLTIEEFGKYCKLYLNKKSAFGCFFLQIISSSR